MKSEIQLSELTRLQALHRYQILETPPEDSFTDLALLAAQVCEAPIAAVTFVDAERQWAKACVGLSIPEMERSLGLCQFTIQGQQPVMVADILADARFAQSLLTWCDVPVRCFVGVPLLSPSGDAVGTLCVMDTAPRHLTAVQVNALQLLAKQVVTLLELRVASRSQEQLLAQSEQSATSGRMQRLGSVALDVNAQKEAERALRESEKRFSRLFSSAAAGITLRHPTGNYLQANPAFCAMVGYAEEELQALDHKAITHPDDLAQSEEIVQKLLRGEVDSDVLEKRFIKKNGEIAWARVSISSVHSELNEPLYIIGVSEDITERVNAQTIASGLAQRLAMTLEHMTDAFCLLDRDWRVSYLNKEAERLIMHSSREMMNVTLWDRFPPTMGSALYAEFHRAVRDNEPVHFELFYPPLKNWFEVHAYPMPDGLAIYFRVITERKMAVEALRTSEERFKIVARATNDAIWDWDLTTNQMWWSEGFFSLFGYAPQELDGTITSWTKYIHPDDKQWVLESIYKLIHSGGENWSAEYRFLGKEGSVVHVLDRGFLIHNAEGKPIRMVGSMIDLTERIIAEDALRESEERFRQLAETIEDVFWIWDPYADRVLYASPRYEVVFGRSRQALYHNSRDFTHYIHPDDRVRLAEAAAKDSNSMQIDYRLLLEGGQTRWVSVRTFPVYDEEGKVRHSVGIARDITQLMEATQQLRASEQQYRLLFANNPHPMWVFDSDTLRFLAVNDQAIAHYGYSEEEFLSMTLRDIRPVEDIAKLESTIAHLGVRHNLGIWRHRKKDGSLIDVEISSDSILFNGRNAGLVLATDITARRRAEEQVRQQAALLDKAQDAIMVHDLDHCITYWNHGAERLYGWRADEAIGRKSNQLLYRDSVSFHRAHQQLMGAGEWQGEMHQIDRFGNELLVEMRWTLVRDEDGKPQAVLSITTDITERRKLEAQFLRAQRMESIGTLAGGIAHDLNNVLAPILLSLGMLKRLSRTPAEQKLLGTLESSAQRGADMVRQVLTFARGVEGERVVVDVGKIVCDLESLIRETFDRSISFQVRVADHLLPILGDPTQIHQVLLNLCVNARDAMPDGGELIVDVSTVYLDSPFASMDLVAEPGHYVVLRVTDTGIGIPADIRDRIFDPFFTTKDVGKGTGLGLPTVQAVIKSHGGFINVYSEEGHGTEFRVYLPALENEAEHETSVPSEQPMNSDGVLILVVDDEPAIRMITQQTLESYGYRVLTADGGNEALSLYAVHQDEIAVVLTDMMMPGMDGFAIIHQLRQVNPHVKIIAASGLAAHDTVAKATEVGVTHFLQKPYTTESLLKVLGDIREEDAPARH